MRWLLVGVSLSLAAAFAGCEDPECEVDADCAEVVCPDLSKHRVCKDDETCFKIEDCPAGSGW